MMMTMTWISGLAGALAAGAGLAVLMTPGAVRRGVDAFPRHVWAGRVLTAGALFWVATIVFHAELGRFSFIKPSLYVLTPVAIGLISWLLVELLAPRALGGWLLLLANPVLAIGRLVDSPWRIAVAVAAYLGVLAGMILIVGPHWFRRSLRPALATARRSATLGFLLLAAGLFFLGLALGPFRAS